MKIARVLPGRMAQRLAYAARVAIRTTKEDVPVVLRRGGAILVAGASGLAFSLPLALVDSNSTLAATWPDTPLARVEALAILKTFDVLLLTNPSATVVLQDWCREHHLAPQPRLVAHRVATEAKPLTSAQREDLQIGPDVQVRYRRVELVCGSDVLSVADNWYVPDRLTPEMNRELDSTDTPFGRVVAALHFTRRNLEDRLLWSPLPPDWDMRKLPPAGSVPISFPFELLRHRAVLSRADGTPFSEVIETYTNSLLDFQPP
jgi:chorismate-pyruvate lyase